MPDAPVSPEPTRGKRLSTLKQLLFASGNFGVGLGPTAVGAFLGYYYHGRETDAGVPIILVPAATFGIIWFLCNALNAFTDPIVGYMSDKTRSRLGRRRPWVLIGAPLLALSFFFLWTPPTDAPSFANTAVLFVSLLCFWLFFTVVVAPYLSMLPDITPYDNERVRISVFMGILGDVLGAAAGNLMPVLVGLFAGGLLFLSNGWQVVALIFAGCMVLFYTLAAGLTQEVYKPGPPEAESREGMLGRAMREFLSVFKNKAFRPYVVAVFFFRMAFITIAFITPFIATKVLGSYPIADADLAFLNILPGVVDDSGVPDWAQAAAYLMMAVMIGAMIFFPLVDWLSNKIGKRLLFILALLWMGVVLMLTSTLGTWPFFTPLVQALTLFILASFPVAVAMILTRPLLADVIDADQLHTGQRREGLYNGMEGFIMKISAGIGPMLAEFLFAAFGSSKAENLGIRICGLVAGACLLVAAITFTRYPIKK